MAAGDAYTARYDKITQGFKRMEQCMGDTILYDSNLEENFDRVCHYITKCSRADNTFNKEKFCFGQKQREYLGYHLGKASLETSEDILRSITKFPEPKDITGVRSWFGLTNHVDCFHSDWSIIEAMWPLLKPAKAGEKWADRWGQEQRLAFERSRT